MLTRPVRSTHPGIVLVALLALPREPKAFAQDLAVWSPRSVSFAATSRGPSAVAAPALPPSGPLAVPPTAGVDVASGGASHAIVDGGLPADASSRSVDGGVGVASSAEPARPASPPAWIRVFPKPMHLGYLRATFGKSATDGVPTVFRWEILAPRRSSGASDADGWVCAGGVESKWQTLPDARQDVPYAIHFGAEPTQRSWHLDTDVCALRLMVDKTLGDAPVVSDVRIVEGARDVADEARFDDRSRDASAEGYAVDRGWVGDPADSDGRWTATLRWSKAHAIDRVRLELGFTSTAHARGPRGGRNYGLAFAPHRYEVQVSRDGHGFVTIGHEVRTEGGSTVVPVRRRLLRSARTDVLALRIVVTSATDADGRAGTLGSADQTALAFPVVRSVEAYAADDVRPVLAAPWVLSVNANPLASSHSQDGHGERDNDHFYTQFLRYRFFWLIPRLSRAAEGTPGLPYSTSGFTKALSMLRVAAPAVDDYDGALETIEGDDPALNRELLAESSPPPITVLSGSNSWDFATTSSRSKRAAPSALPTAASAKGDAGAAKPPPVLFWDPLLDASQGGMGRLASAVRERVAPFFGFCGGAQILALLDARSTHVTHDALMDNLLRRNSGRPIQGESNDGELEYAWPWTSLPRRTVSFDPKDSLFADVASGGRVSSNGFLLKHHDALRRGAFEAGGPLAHLQVDAWSSFCSPHVVAAPGDVLDHDASGTPCRTLVQAFRSRGDGYPLIGTQFHAEQFDFPEAAPGDVPWSSADARLLIARMFEAAVDAHLRDVAHGVQARTALAVGHQPGTEQKLKPSSPATPRPRS